MKEVLGIDGLGECKMAVTREYADFLGQTASAPAHVPGAHMAYGNQDLFGLGAIVPTLPTDASLYDRPTMTMFDGLGAVVPTLPTRASLYQRPVPTIFSGLGQLDFKSAAGIEQIAGIAAIAGAAAWLLMPSNRAKDIAAKVLGGGLAAVAGLKLARATGLAS